MKIVGCRKKGNKLAQKLNGWKDIGKWTKKCQNIKFNQYIELVRIRSESKVNQMGRIKKSFK